MKILDVAKPESAKKIQLELRPLKRLGLHELSMVSGGNTPNTQCPASYSGMSCQINCSC